MTLYSEASVTSDLFSAEGLRNHWQHLNTRYFSGALPPIAIHWSRRLTSSVGMFTSLRKTRTFNGQATAHSLREIRLSLPLFERLTDRTRYAEQELLNTLAHEMIHQWQFDILKRRPDHGLEFARKMTEINRSGEVAVTTYHSLETDVLALSRFAWRCKSCGYIYRRQRKSIHPKRHHCGVCQGPLQELTPSVQSITHQPRSPITTFSNWTARSSQPRRSVERFEQLSLALT